MKRIMAKFGGVVAIFVRASGGANRRSRTPRRTRKRAPRRRQPRLILSSSPSSSSNWEAAISKRAKQRPENLVKLDEAPDALRQAAKSADAEVARRAEIAIRVIILRIEEKEFQAMIGDLDKIEPGIALSAAWLRMRSLPATSNGKPFKPSPRR